MQNHSDTLLSLSEQARAYAVQCHEQTNHRYDDKSYSFHLEWVAGVASRFMGDQFAPEEQELILAGCWVHDVIEDCRETYNDVKQALGEEVAELAYALTNEKGRNRKERANDRYYEGIRQTKFAPFIKFCDRVANVEYSISTGSRMSGAYQKEMANFCQQLNVGEEVQEIMEHLQKILSAE